MSAARKADGVYYTPSEIVDFMVAATLGPLLKDRTPQQVSMLHVLDPACGAGSFLLGVYQFLLDWHLDFYVQDAAKHARDGMLCRVGQGEWRLTGAEKMRILQNNVHGVDIDAQAIEAAKLALLRKALEGETPGELAVNIKCGNALIEPDFSEQEFGAPHRTETIRPFDWPTEFPRTFSREAPGFDLVIGNPPYVDSEWMTTHRPATRAYCARKYAAGSGNWDLFCVFVERALQLLRDGGLHGFIVPNKVASVDYAAPVRRLLATDNRLLLLRDYSRVPVFPVAVYPLVYIVVKGKEPGKSVLCQVMRAGPGGASVETKREIDYESGFGQPERAWPIFADEMGVLQRLEELPRLEAVADVFGGATVAEAYELLPLLADEKRPSTRDLRVLNSGIIDPHRSLWGLRAMRYLGKRFSHPVVRAEEQSKLPKTRLKQARTPKIIIAGMTKNLECVADINGEYLAAKSTTIVIPKRGVDLVYLAAVLNSRLMTYLYRSMFCGLALRGGYLRVGPPQIRQLPIQTGVHAGVVDDIRSWAVALEKERTTFSRSAQVLQKQIDEAICEIHGLGPKETRVVLAGA